MLWWGSSNKFFNLGALGMRLCPTCEKDRSFSLMLSYRLHHIWTLFRWITGKTYSVVCDTCGHGHKADAAEIEGLADKHPVPWFDRFGWAIGVGLIALLVVVGVVGDERNKSEDNAFVAAPHPGDIYKVDFARMVKNPEAPLMYSVMRVMAVSGNDVKFELSKTYYARLKGVDSDIRTGKADAADYYGPDPIVIPLPELKKFHDDGTINDIERK